MVSAKVSPTVRASIASPMHRFPSFVIRQKANRRRNKFRILPFDHFTDDLPHRHSPYAWYQQNHPLTEKKGPPPRTFLQLLSLERANLLIPSWLSLVQNPPPAISKLSNLGSLAKLEHPAKSSPYFLTYFLISLNTSTLFISCSTRLVHIVMSFVFLSRREARMLL